MSFIHKCTTLTSTYVLSPPPSQIIEQLDLESKHHFVYFYEPNYSLLPQDLKYMQNFIELLQVCFCSVPVFFLFWNCNRVDLRGTVTIFCVALSWIILFYLKNTGVNFLLSYCIIFFVLLGVFCFASFVWNWFTSISKEKGPFSVILSDVLFFVLSRIQA